MQLDSLTLYQNRLEGLDTKTMQSRSTVQHNRMLFDDVFQYIPYLRLYLTLYHFLCALDVVRGTVLYQLLHNEGLEQLDGHLLRKTALINLQLRAYDDNGTSGIVNTLTQQVLTEPSLLTAQHIGQRFQRPVAGAGYRPSAAAVIDKSVDRFLQHALFVPDNDIRSAQAQQAAKTVVTVNHASVQIIQVRGRKAAAVQLYHGPQIRWNDRDHIHDHPFRTVAGLQEGFQHFQALDNPNPLLTGRGCQLYPHLGRQLFQINLFQ